MVLKYCYYIIVLAIVCVSLTLSQCKTTETDEYFYCFDCRSEYPDSERVKINLTINAENQKVLIQIFTGKFNPTQLTDTVYSDTVNKSEITVKLATDLYYSVAAIYKKGKDSIIAIDGGKFEARKISGCQNTCWQLYGGIYDVRLKKY